MLSLDTTPANVDPIGSGVLCPSRTHLTFHVKSIFTCQMRWPVTSCQPAGVFCPSSNTSKATPTLYISFISASLHMVLLLVLLSSIACSTLVGILTPYLCVVFLMRCLIDAMMALCFFRTYGVHHVNVGLLSIRRALANSAVSTGWDSFRSLSLAQDPSNI